MKATSRNPLAAHRYQHKPRVFLESFTKVAVASGLAFVIALHVYTAAMLLYNEILPETIYPTLVFDAFIGGGCFILLAICGRGKRGPLVEWLSWLVVSVVTIYTWILFYEELGSLDLAMSYFPGATILLLVWSVAMLLSVGYIFGVAIGAIVSFSKRGGTLRRARPKSRAKSGLAFIGLLAVVVVAPLVTNAVIADGTVKRTISIVDTNNDCTLSVWDIPNFLGVAWIPGTPNINLTKITENENYTRILNAFAAMNTTFYYRFGIDTVEEQNVSVALLKVLDAFNLTLCWVVKDDSNMFPGPGNPESWIRNARETIEFVKNHSITNVIGICADSESDTDQTAAEYWANIDKYDAFLNEFQTNASLAHPDPTRGTFKTVLCYSPLALEDFVDGDQDITVGSRELGLPPNSWTDYHFMIYRVGKGNSPPYLHNYLVLAKRYLGTSASVPIVGLTGVDWFAEGYTDDVNIPGREGLPYRYDGVDGWDAMKREILYPKAMGFHSVSVFHLNGYPSLDPTETFGLLDYYGIDAIENLSASWNAGLTIEYPVSSMDFRIGAEAFFNPNSAIVYDLYTNIESLVVQICLLAIAIAYAVLKAAAKWLFPGSYHVIERRDTDAESER